MASSNEHSSHHDTNEDWMKVLDNFLDNESTDEVPPKDGHIGESKVKQREKSSTNEAACNRTTDSNEENPESTRENPESTRENPDSTSHSPNDPLVVTEPVSTSLGHDSHPYDESTSTDSNLNISTSNDAAEEDADAKVQSRSERKRDREKQRRSDVNLQFSALASLLKKMESNPEDFDSDVDTDEESDTFVDSAKKKRKRLSLLTAPSASVCSGGSSSLSNRVDLIAKTIAVLEKLCELNNRRREDCRGLKKELRDAKKLLNEALLRKDGELFIADGSKTKRNMKPQQPVMMMVPMMVSPDSISHQNGMPTSGVPSMYPYPMPYMNPSNSMQANAQLCYPLLAHHQPVSSTPHQVTMSSNTSNGHPTGHAGWQPAMVPYPFQQDVSCSQTNATSTSPCGVPLAGVPSQSIQTPNFNSNTMNTNPSCISNQPGRLVSTPPHSQSPGVNNSSQTSSQPQVQWQQNVGKASSYGGNLAHCA